MQNTIVDLDELVLKCRNDAARNHIKEAVMNYRVGAYRSTIVSTWLAVIYDVVDKYRELSILGDSVADVEYNKYLNLLKRNDLGQALTFERTLLKKIHTDFSFITARELVDLERIRVDRNRCAHPYLDLDFGIYQPSAELARTHLRIAVESLLQYPATTSQKAEEIVLNELESEFLRMDENSVKTIMRSTPIHRLRKTSVSSLLKTLFEKIFSSTTEKVNKYKWTIEILEEIYPTESQQFLTDDFNSIIRRKLVGEIDQRSLLFLIQEYTSFDYFSYLKEDLLLKINSYIEGIKIVDEKTFSTLLGIAEECRISLIRDWGLARIKKFTIDDYKVPSSTYCRGALVDRFIDIFINSKSFAETRKNFEAYKRVDFKWTEAQVKRVLYGVYGNGQILSEGFETKVLDLFIAGLRRESEMKEEAFTAILRRAIDRDSTLVTDYT